MNRSEVIHVQERVGALGDGFWGPKSIASCQSYLKSLMPAPAIFPVEGSKEFLDFFGNHGVKNGFTPPSKKIKLPFVIYYENIAVSEILVHKKCADSLLRVFERLSSIYPDQASRQKAGVLSYSGLYNPRLKRGSLNSWSMHAWMNAIDINASENGNKTSWPVSASMPIEVMECFAQEGWMSAGAFWGRDAMHFQATSPE